MRALGVLGRVRRADGLKAAIVEPVGGHGGMDYYDFGLCEGLSKAGTRVTLYTCDETRRPVTPSYRVEYPYRKVYGSDPTWRRGVRYLRGSLNALWNARWSGAEAAHLHFFHVGPLELFNVLLAKLLGLRVVVTAHDVQSFVERLSVPWMVRTAYRLSDRVVAQSRISKRELIEVLQVPENKVAMIPHGNYLHSVGEMPTQEEARGRLKLPQNGRVLLFFGQIKKVKGLDILLRAMPQVVEKHPDVVLLIAGKMWKDTFEAYQRQIKTLGIVDNCISHIRYIPDFEVADYYAAADAVVLPYRRIYQSGVLLMAMSYGKPVVASDVDGMMEIISDGVNGYLFRSGDAKALADKLVEALACPEKLRIVGRKGLAYVAEHHDWNRIGRMTMACYESVLDG